MDRLVALGCEVYDKSTNKRGGGDGGANTEQEQEKEPELDWSALAGYEHIRRDVEDTVLLALKHPEAYEAIARETRATFESNRPKAVLFEGPPGTGKTTTARIIAAQAQVPMVYVPVEAMMSKWFGESEKKLSEVRTTTHRVVCVCVCVCRRCVPQTAIMCVCVCVCLWYSSRTPT